MPTTFNKIASHNEINKNNIELLLTGSSQVQGGLNPEYIDIPTINFSSGSQHHREDFAIFSQLKNQYPKLKYVLFELSFAHLDIPHNDKTFWKNATYLKYYGVNAYERNTYFKDKLLYISNPDVFSKLIDEYYISKSNTDAFNYNKYGFLESDNGLFKVLHYDTTDINKRNFRIRNEENPLTFEYNTTYFKNMIEEANKAGLQVIIATVPTYKTYIKARNPNLIKRRDSILNQVMTKYDNVSLFNFENDTINFQVTDFLNENHLNPKGAEKLSKLFNNFLKENVLDD
ncbi:MAG: hypothetical protein ACSHW7_14685 [Patiriisocius sp.]|uniref:hypothetical protein n=1 Tax=Patiriisocius sp. TaxID=2822396 RepID=UPI003EF4D41A